MKKQKGSSSLHNNFILNSCIVYELNNWPHNPTNNFPLENCLFGTVKLTRNAVKSKFTYEDQGKAFNGGGSWSSDNDSARNLRSFRVGNSSSSRTDNCKKNLYSVRRKNNFWYW